MKPFNQEMHLFFDIFLAYKKNFVKVISKKTCVRDKFYT